MNDCDEIIDVCDTQQASSALSSNQHLEQQQQQHQQHQQQSYSIYEPNYQQMHPLIYYEDPISHNHHILSSAVSQLWDQEHYVHMPMIPFGDTSSGTCSAAMQMNSHPIYNNLNSLRPGDDDEDEVALRVGSCAEVEANEEEGGEGENEEEKEEIVEENGIKTEQEEEEGDKTNNDTDNPTKSVDLENLDRIIIKLEPSDCFNSTQQTNREVHNEIERRRRLRIKQCCDILRNLVPGLSDKTDKATVLEHTVKYVNHLSECPNFKCNCNLE